MLFQEYPSTTWHQGQVCFSHGQGGMTFQTSRAQVQRNWEGVRGRISAPIYNRKQGITLVWLSDLKLFLFRSVFTIQWCWNRGRGPGGPLAPPVFCRSVNPIWTGEGRLSPPITTAPPMFFTFRHHCNLSSCFFTSLIGQKYRNIFVRFLVQIKPSKSHSDL